MNENTLFRRDLKTAHSLRWDAIALACYTVFAIIFTYPYLFKTHHFLAAASSDYCQRLWMFWWFKKALFSFQNSLYFTDYLYYPHGCSLLLTPLSEFNSFLSVLLSPFLSLVDMHRYLIIGHFIFAPFAMYKLARHFSFSPGAAFIGGMVCGFAGYRATHELIFASTGWIILTMLFFFKLFQDGRARYGILAGICYALSCLCSWYYLIFLFVFFVGFIVYFSFLTPARILNKKNVLPFCTFVIVFLACVLPFIMPFVKSLVFEEATFSEISVERQARISPDLTGYPAWQKRSGESETVDTGKRRVYYDTCFIFWVAIWGYPVVALALIGILMSPNRRTFFWVFIFLIFFVLSLGPYLHILGRQTGIPLPMLILYKLPVFSFARGAHRFIIMHSIILSVLAAIGSDALLLRKKMLPRVVHRRFAVWITALLSLAIFVEFIDIPKPLTRVPVPPIYKEISEKTGDFSILEIPFGMHYGSLNMYYQTIHGKKLLDGHLGRVTQQKALKRWLKSTPLLRELSNPDRLASLSLEEIDKKACLKTLGQTNVGCIILNKRRVVGDFSSGKTEPYLIRKKNNLIFMPFRFLLSEDILLLKSFSLKPYPIQAARRLMESLLGPPSSENKERAIWWLHREAGSV